MDQQYVPPVHLTRSSWGNRGHDGQQRYFVPGMSPLVSSSHAVIMLTNSLCRRRRRDNEVEIIDVGTKWLVHYTVIIRRQCHPSSVGGAASGSSVCRISRQRPPLTEVDHWFGASFGTGHRLQRLAYDTFANHSSSSSTGLMVRPNVTRIEVSRRACYFCTLQSSR